MNIHELFRRLAHRTAEAVGSPLAFGLAVIIIVAWALSGPFFGFSTTWQLLINTGTTIATLLIVFLIQNTQNRETKAMHLKLDELILAVRKARDKFVDVEDMSDQEINRLQEQFEKVRARVTKRDENREKNTP